MGLAHTPLRNGTLSRRRSRAQFAIERGAREAQTPEGAAFRDFTTESQNSIRRCPTRSGARSRAVSNTRYHDDPRQDLNLRSPAPQADDFATKRKNSVWPAVLLAKLYDSNRTRTCDPRLRAPMLGQLCHFRVILSPPPGIEPKSSA